MMTCWFETVGLFFVFLSLDTPRRVLPDNATQLIGGVSGPLGIVYSVWSGQCGSLCWYFALSHSEAWSVSFLAYSRLPLLVGLHWSLRRNYPVSVDWLGRYSSPDRIVNTDAVHYAGSLEYYQSFATRSGDISARATLRTSPVSRGCLTSDSPAWVRFLQHRGMRIISTPIYFRYPLSVSVSPDSSPYYCYSRCSLPSSSCAFSITIPMLSVEETAIIN
jgi:hypothetical protein